MEHSVKSGKPILLVAEDVESDVVATLVINRLKGGLRVCAVKAPAFGDNRKNMMQDIAILTGATYISEEVGMSLDNVDLGALG